MIRNISKILFILLFFCILFCDFIDSALLAENLPTPEQILPEQAAKISTLYPEFVLSSVSTASYYSFQLTTDVTFLNFEDSTNSGTTSIIKNNLIDTVYTSEVGLLPDTLYFWRVSARVATDTIGEWSSIRYLKTPKNNGIFSNFDNQLEIKIFPNPATEVAQININNLNIKNKSQNCFFLYLFDINGGLIKKIDNSKTGCLAPATNKIYSYSQNVFF